MVNDELVEKFFAGQKLDEGLVVHKASFLEAAERIADNVKKINSLADDIQRDLDIVEIYPNSPVAEELASAVIPFNKLAQSLYDKIHKEEPEDNLVDEFFLG